MASVWIEEPIIGIHNLASVWEDEPKIGIHDLASFWVRGAKNMSSCPSELIFSYIFRIVEKVSLRILSLPQVCKL